MKTLYLVTAIFNPRRFKSRYKLYNQFVNWLKPYDVKLLTVEIAFGQRPWVITETGNPWHLQLRTSSELWHKERALNLGLRHLTAIEPYWEYVAWIDADIRITRDDWAEETVHLLQHHAVLQLFGEARSLDYHHHALPHSSCMKSFVRVWEDNPSCVWTDNPGLKPSTLQAPPVQCGHPGLGWSFRRHELEQLGGWLDVCINGSGDTHMAGCYVGKSDLALNLGFTQSYKDRILAYGDRAARFVRGNVGMLPGACDHYFHGYSHDRGYDDRWKYLVKYQFNPATDLHEDIQGLYVWNHTDPRVQALAYETRRSLSRRNEDAV